MAAELLRAAQAGSVEDFKQAAASFDGDLRQAKDEANGAGLLHVAAHGGKTELCEHLLDACGCDINAQDGSGSTPLALAIEGGHVNTAEALLERGPDINARRGGADGAAPLHLAVAGEHQDLAQRLAAAGADVNAASSSGTPLMLAASRSNAALIEALLAAGADAAAAPDARGLTPLFMAVAVGSCPRCVALLAKAGCDVNGRAYGSFTPLHVAAEMGKLEPARALLEAGADPSLADEYGHTPARVAAMHGHRELAALLLGRTGEGGSAGASGSGAGEAAPADLDAYMKSSKEDLKQREAKASAAGAGGGASVVAIPEPELADEALSDTFKRKGNEMFVACDYATAAEMYKLALSHWTKNPVVWSNRAACFLRLGRHEKALQDAQVARTLDPKYVKAWYREGRAAEGLGRWEEAASAYFQASQLQPDNDEFMDLTRAAIVEGRKAYQAAQQAQQQGGKPGGKKGGGGGKPAAA